MSWPVRPAARALARRLRGLPGRTPRFAGATLSRREADLARQQLEKSDADLHDDGPVRDLERRFAAWVGASSGSAFFAGRVALTAALRALRLRPGDEVLVPGYTCIVVPNAIRFEGLVPVFVDVELATFGMDAEAARRARTPRTRAVLLHHLYGLVARDAAAIREWARAEGLAVVEDCAQASGALEDGSPVGAGADVAIHSLEKTKVLTSIVGGLATTRSAELGERLRQVQAGMPAVAPATERRLLRNVLLYEAFAHAHGSWRREAERLYGADRWVSTGEDETAGRRPTGYGQRYPAALALIALAQLDRAEALNAERRRRARRWDAWARANGHEPATVVTGSTPVFLRYPVLVPPAMKQGLSWGQAIGVEPGVWFTGELHPVPFPMPQCPNAHDAVLRCVNLPTLW